MLESREKREKREKEGLWLHGMIAPCALSLADVWTRKSRVLTVAAEPASGTFVPKREKGKGGRLSAIKLRWSHARPGRAYGSLGCERMWALDALTMHSTTVRYRCPLTAYKRSLTVRK